MKTLKKKLLSKMTSKNLEDQEKKPLHAKLILPDSKTIELPIREGALGPSVIDVRELYAQTDYFTYDPGFMSTASCDSSITFIDGDEGVLMHRGYDIVDLAEKCDFMRWLEYCS